MKGGCVDTRGGPRATLAVLLWAVVVGAGAPRALSAQIATICDRTPSSQWGLAPSIDVLYYQGPCNPKLVPGRKAMVRVYLNWQRYQDKQSVPMYDVQVELFSGSGAPIVCSSSPGGSKAVRRPDLYKASEKRNAENSVNFFGCDLDGVVELEARVTLPGRDQPITQTRKVEHMRSAQKIDARVVFPTVGSWSDGVPHDAKQAGTTLLLKGREFALHNLPIGDVRLRIPAEPEVRVVEPHLSNEEGLFEESWSVREGPCPDLQSEQCRMFVEDDLVFDDEELPRTWVFEQFEERYSDHLVIAIVPRNFGGTAWMGKTTRRRGLSPKADSNSLQLNSRSRAVVFIREDADYSTVAHELGHYLGLPHHDGTMLGGRTSEVEGFLATGAGSFNKSAVEGNQDPRSTNRLFSLMVDGRPDPAAPYVRFIMNSQYRVLAEDLEEDPLPTLGARSAPPQRRASVSPRSTPWVGAAPAGGPSDPAPEMLVARPSTGHSISGRTVRVGGVLSTEGGEGRLRPLEWIPFDAGLPQEAGGRIVRVVDGSGATLASAPVDARPIDSPGETTESASLSFSATISWPDGAQAVQLVATDGSILDERSGTPSPPSVDFLAPEQQPDGSGSTLRWQGRDPDGDPLRYSVYYSRDGGQAWTLLASELSDPVLGRRALDPGPAPRLVVAASDGFHVATDTVAPEVAVEPAPLGYVPARGDTVAAGAVVRIQLNTDLPEDVATAEPLRLEDDAGALVESALSYDSASRALELRPAAPLEPSGQYTVRLLAGFEDAYGNRSGGEVSWTFRVEADTEAPFVEWSDPRPGARSIALDAPIHIRFSEPVDPASLDDVRLLRDGDDEIDAAIRFDADVRSVMIVPDEPLPPRSLIRVVVPSRVEDVHGNRLDEESVWEFRTAGAGG